MSIELNVKRPWHTQKFPPCKMIPPSGECAPPAMVVYLVRLLRVPSGAMFAEEMYTYELELSSKGVYAHTLEKSGDTSNTVPMASGTLPEIVRGPLTLLIF